MKRRLLLDVSGPEAGSLETPPSTPSGAVRTGVNQRHSFGTTSPLSLDPPIYSPRSVEDEEISKELSIRSDPGPSWFHQDANVSGVRKLRRIKRRLFLETLAADNVNINAKGSNHPNIATRSVSEPSAVTGTPMKTVSFAEHGATHANTVSPVPSPRLSLRRMKRRLFLDHLESSDLDIGKIAIASDDHGEILQKASSSSLDQPLFVDSSDPSPFLMLDSWTDKVENERSLQDPPKLRLKSSFPTFPDISKRKREDKDPQEKTLDGLSSKLELLSLNQAMNYRPKESKTAFMGSSNNERSMMPRAESSNAAIYI